MAGAREPVVEGLRDGTRPGTSMWAAAPHIVAYWTASIGVVLMNADILRKLHCPATLTAWHQFCCTVLVYTLRWLAPSLFDCKSPRLGLADVLKRVTPIAVLFALTLGVGNRAYMYLSVAFIQMVKAGHPVMTYVLSCVLGIEAFRQNKLQAAFLVTLGVMLSVGGELHFDLRGFGYQILGSLAECLRVVLIGLLLSGRGLRMDPLTTVSYIAPIAFLVLLPAAALTERPPDPAVFQAELEAKVGYGMLLLNGLLAFALNIAVVSLISRTDPVLYVVVGVVKDILTVIISAFFFASPVTRLQVSGYLIALAGVQVYNLVQQSPADFEVGVPSGLLAVAKRSLPLFSGAASYGATQQDTPKCQPMGSVPKAVVEGEPELRGATPPLAAKEEAAEGVLGAVESAPEDCQKEH